MKHLPLRECGYAILLTVLLCVLYVGAYVALMERGIIDTNVGVEMQIVRYRCGGEWAEWFFAAAHAIDGRLRPSIWSNELDPAEARELIRRFPVAADLGDALNRRISEGRPR